MKKIFLSFSLIVVFALFATFSRRNVGIGADRFLTPNVSVLATSPISPAPLPSGVVTVPDQTIRAVEPKSTPTSVTTKPVATKPVATTPTPAPAPKPTGQYVDGTYNGSVADAYYGNIQVQAVISGGKLTDVIFLQHPNDRRTSIEINDQAMPYLKAEALLAQNASVDIVSGASDSSQAFRESLGVALALAKN